MAALFSSGCRACTVSLMLGIKETALDEVCLDAREWPYFSEVDSWFSRPGVGFHLSFLACSPISSSQDLFEGGLSTLARFNHARALPKCHCYVDIRYSEWPIETKVLDLELRNPG